MQDGRGVSDSNLGSVKSMWFDYDMDPRCFEFRDNDAHVPGLRQNVEEFDLKYGIMMVSTMVNMKR